MIETPYWIDRLERKLGWTTIPHLALYLVALQAMGYFLMFSKPEMAALLTLSPEAVLSGEWWRLFTFLVIPLSDGIWVIFFLWALFFVVNSLAGLWGDFKVTLYFGLGWLATVGFSMLLGIETANFLYIDMTFLLALATLMPEFEVLFLFFPIKLKWLGLYSAAVSFALPLATSEWQARVYILASVSNYLLFFGPEFLRDLRREMRRREELRKRSA